jgi:hypothetical protein
MIALVLGGASCVWDDAFEAIEKFNPGLFVACNDIGTRWSGPLDAWVTLHPEKMAKWRSERAAQGFSEAFEHVAAEDGHAGIDRVADYRWPGMTASGSSGLFAVKIALEKADKVILAGVPMTPTAHFFDDAPWAHVRSFNEAWKTMQPFLKGKVASMSGWTRELLGGPENWLAG